MGSNGTIPYDLVTLSSPSEDDVTHVLEDNFEQNNTYLKIGAHVLLSLNHGQISPRKSAELEEYINDFRDAQPTYGDRLRPHIFQTVSHAYLEMRRTGYNQSIVFSGETGSGKSTNKFLALEALGKIREPSKKESHVVKLITNACKILEAFGNAGTVRNPNASRFGSYIEIQFNERGRILGSKFLDYLLEKSRVTQPTHGEQNFHVFHYLHNGASIDERVHFHFADTAEFSYLPQNSAYIREDDARKFHELRDCMKSLGLNKKYQNQIFRLLAAILHLGNLTFVDAHNKNLEASSVKNVEVLDTVAEFLGVSTASLESVLTYKTQLVKKEMCTIFLDAKHAEIQRDSLARALYSLLFSWIVEFVNTKLCSEEQTNFIGLVDMMGFQNRSVDSFNQFCVNFANERIHNFLNHQIFELNNIDYEDQGIAVPNIAYFDNSSCIDLIMKPKTGLISIMDNLASKSENEVSDQELLEALENAQNSHDSFISFPGDSHSGFAIRHYAGKASYSIQGFMEKNTENIGTDFIDLFRGGSDVKPTSNSFIAGLFSNKTVSYQSHPRNNATIVGAQQSAAPTRKPSMRRTRKKDSNKECRAMQFQQAVSELIETLEETTPWFVICIQPNIEGNPNQFDFHHVKSQVRRLGLSQIAERQRFEYTSSVDYDSFVRRYGSHVDLQEPASREAMEQLRTNLGWSERDMMLGSTKVFLNFAAWKYLEDQLRAAENEDRLRRKSTGTNVETMSQAAPSIFTNSGTVNESREYFPATGRVSSPGPVPREYPLSSNPVDNRSFYSGAESYYSDEDYYERESSSIAGTEPYPLKPVGLQEVKREAEVFDPKEHQELSKPRKRWLCCTWALTFWIPTFTLSMCGRMKRPDVQIAWREKTALCMIIFFLCIFVLFFLIFFGRLICPRQYVYSSTELARHTSADSPFVSIRGEVFTIKNFVHYTVPASAIITEYAGKEVGDLLFPMQISMVCDGYDGPIDPAVVMNNYTDVNHKYHDFRYHVMGNQMTNFYQHNVMAFMRAKYLEGQMAYSTQTVRDFGRKGEFWAILDNMVYDLTAYVNGHVGTLFPPGAQTPRVNTQFLDPYLVDLFRYNLGSDITHRFNNLYLDKPELKQKMKVCLQNLFYKGVVDTRNSPQCKFSNYILLACTIFLGSVIFFKFLAALQLGSRREPEEHDKFVICQVPCYTEGEESLKNTIDSLAVLKYDDKRKLLFIIADGMIIGGGNDKPTPRIVLDILGVDESVDPKPVAYKALGEGNQQLNMAKVYTGLYECSGHVVPFMVVVKVGKPSERSKPGNRGKRDSQLIIMNFFNKVHFDRPMCPLELEMYHTLKNVIGVDPYFYEYVLMVDADTIVMPDSLNRMVSCMLNDSKIMGICGETELLNGKATITTMIQVYEYFISHHLAKAFESLFGSVTCLPGCFSMYRFRTPVKAQPLLIADCIVNDYSENKVDTLHKRNLLSLGEDRYLTTLMLKHFNYNKMTFTPDAKCKTNAPDQWSVLLSQRRRWINSTVHNLFELVYLPRLCGFCCFSMRFVVMIDLISTMIMPILCIYLGYLIYSICTDTSNLPLTSIILLAAIYGLQVIIFLVKRQWQHIGWMIVYLISLPIFSFFLPVYSFWHFDDFSWGNTRVVVGESGKVAHVATEEKFDPASVPLKKWSEYELENWEIASQMSDSKDSRVIGSMHSENRSRSQISRVSRADAPSPYQSMSTLPRYGFPAEAYSSRNNSRERSMSPGYAGLPRSMSRATSYDRAPSSNPYSTVNSSSDMRLPVRSFSSSSLNPNNPFSNYNGAAIPPEAGESYFPEPQVNVYPASNPSTPGIPNLPSDEEILQEVRTILSTADLMSITKKQVRDELTHFFGVDMTIRKEYINNCIDMILQGQL
ncbi:hypothetical protein K493DRAFT_312084 [Basidiobolus meristosporus CBS 931.73]|uniref:chitin synthase n=1 Tax=Basidiobolus meristosporus CBS 931.73 TaxID=1314790 RepID=A0A1Y1YXJ8_9FUNG|nr:hypothetical protein K493DRAFT_312084 [Basidiobolus meristosporus CBS 931.73]|eukprot:ORY02427.1 hypothetical protein K493DRAFT_312084 [Basidiobolus meristosporus CBS 931.73]